VLRSILQKRYLLMETHVRSVAKAVSWRIVATLTTVLLVYVFTRNLVVSGGVGVTELLSKLLIYYVHERVWNAIGFGRIKKT
jgi:adenylylsulfate kinase